MTRGDSRSDVCLDITWARASRRETRVSSAENSPPSPLNKTTASPRRRRRTTMTRHPLRQIDLGTEGKLHRCKKPPDARWKTFHAAILSKADPGLDFLCNPMISRKLRLFSLWRCYNPGNKNSSGENGLRRGPAAPIALVALPPRREWAAQDCDDIDHPCF